ncbi:hypothetical protein [Sphingomonas sp. CFBP 13720]|uniref:hypothetical protein n=1 Tax=Sphingomonas sp. CFBP 13720 TaxID=2775302 RepID=UPI001782ED81|nr:hypothetical protein [Sphingomonas sp. CFBP 13720]MBD8677958.1 hypothetical protein [Sphingomonas sp. CFBP 13720]
MPATKRPKPIYQRGDYKLIRRPDRANLEISWYDTDRKRERSASAGTSCDEAGRLALDRLYLERTRGEAICPTCGQVRQGSGSAAVTSAIADYLVMAADKPSIDAIRARLNHVVAYLVASDQVAIRCVELDAAWLERFRKWALAQPIVSPTGKTRERSLSTIENSVLQLAAAINAAHQRGDTPSPAKFRATPVRDVNRTPQHRADVGQIAAMFRYALALDEPTETTAKWLARHRAYRTHLLNYLRAAVATLARPDAILDISTDSARRQWNSTRKVLALNPAARRQTKKYRPTIPVAHQFVPWLDATEEYLIPINSIRSAWDTMAERLQLPGEGEAGTKLIRRSMAKLLRDRLPQTHWTEIEMMLGHDRFDSVSDIYAPFDPGYLSAAKREIEAIIDEIESAAPGAFYRTITADDQTGGSVVSIRKAR